MLAKAGTFVEYSVFTKEVTVDWTIIGDTKGVFVCCGVCFTAIHSHSIACFFACFLTELNIHGGHLGPYCYPKAIEMIAKGQIPMDVGLLFCEHMHFTALNRFPTQILRPHS